MEKEDLIVLDEFCSSHRLEISFIRTLEDCGLIEVTVVDQRAYVQADSLPRLEQIVRLHRELNINPEGIDVIHRLLQRINQMQEELTNLRNKLNLYE